jgi:hypothetical protein
VASGGHLQGAAPSPGMILEKIGSGGEVGRF